MIHILRIAAIIVIGGILVLAFICAYMTRNDGDDHDF